MKIFKLCGYSQAFYFVVTALWPLIDLESFMVVTGYKTDTWLVNTVSAVLLPTALTIFVSTYLGTLWPAAMLGCGTAFSLMSIDIVYYTKGTISGIYLLDALLELIFILLWAAAIVHHFNKQTTKQ